MTRPSGYLLLSVPCRLHANFATNHTAAAADAIVTTTAADRAVAKNASKDSHLLTTELKLGSASLQGLEEAASKWWE